MRTSKKDIVMKIALFLLAFSVAFLSCVTNKAGQLSYDSDSREAQSGMVSTVLIRVSAVVESTAVDRKTKKKTVVTSFKNIGAGTGFILRTDDAKKTSVIMTVHHVGGMPKVDDEIVDSSDKDRVIYTVKRMIRTITTVNGTICLATEKKSGDFALNDMALLDADCVAGEAVRIASRLPPFGAKVFSVAAPLGRKPDVGFAVLDGRYSGSSDGFSAFSIPSIGGCSGAPIFYKGEVVGIVTRVNQFEHGTYAVDLARIQKFVEGM